MFRLFLLLVLCAGVFTTTASAAERVVQFVGESERFSANGQVQLSWQITNEYSLSKGQLFELVRAPTPAFEDPLLVSSGRFNDFFVSGLFDGEYYFRLRVVDETHGTAGPWSDHVALLVEHHSLTLTFVLFGIGAFVVGSVFLFLISVERREAFND